MKKLLILIIISFPFLLKAQTNTSPGYLAVTWHVGPFASGLPNHLEETMKAQGYQPSSGLFGLGGPQPMARQKPVYQLGMEKVAPKFWSGKLLVSTLQGRVSGFSSQSGDLRMNYKIITSALLAGLYSKQKITRIAMGPALHFMSVEGDRQSAYSTPIKKNYLKLGYALEAGIRFPAAGSFFFDFNAQYQKVGKQNMNTYTFKEVDPSGQLHTTTFAAGTNSFSYLTFNFGFGIRLSTSTQ